jgi:hypothetical protein
MTTARPMLVDFECGQQSLFTDAPPGSLFPSPAGPFLRSKENRLRSRSSTAMAADAPSD